MVATIYGVEYKKLDCPDVDFFSSGRNTTFWECMIEAYEVASGEDGTWIYLPSRENALVKASPNGHGFPYWVIEALKKFGDTHGWDKVYFVG